MSFNSADLRAEADHRIANHLALLMGYVRLQASELDRLGDPPSRQALQATLEGVSAQIAAIAGLHRMLVSDPGPACVDLASLLRDICAPFGAGLAGRVRIVEDFAPGCLVPTEQSLPLSQIVAEVITNAVKYAPEEEDKGSILIRCSKEGPGYARVEIIDNGGGLPAGFNPETDGGVGFRLIRSLSRSVRARISFDSTSRGLRVCLTLPTDAHAGAAPSEQ